MILVSGHRKGECRSTEDEGLDLLDSGLATQICKEIIMTKYHVSARAAENNNAPQTSTASQSSNCLDRFSKLITAVIVARAQQRMFEDLRHDETAFRNAQIAWRFVDKQADQLVEISSEDEEVIAIRIFATIFQRLARQTGTYAGREFLAEILNDPEPILRLFRFAGSDRCDRLMSSAFQQIDALIVLDAFSIGAMSADVLAA